MHRILILIIIGLLLSILARAQDAPVTVQISCADKIERSPFVKVGDHYYIFGTTKLNWFNAADYCRTKGAQLASLENSAELTSLSIYMMSQGYTNIYWLSANDLGLEGTYKWSGTGKAFENLTTTDWAAGQPDNFNGNEDCINLMLQDGKFLMNDADCAQTNFFICKASNSKTTALSVWYMMFDGTYGYTTCLMNN